MSLYLSIGAPDMTLDSERLNSLLVETLGKLGQRNNVLVIPPDQTRAHSRAGDLTRFAWQHYGDKLKAILPALGTHSPMSNGQLAHMFGAIPLDLFRVHNWRTDIETLGEVPAGIHPTSNPKAFLNYAWPAPGQQAHLPRQLRSHSLRRPGCSA